MAQAQIGAIRVTLSADSAKFEQGMRKARGEAARTGQDIGKSMKMARTAVIGLALAIPAMTAALAAAAKKAISYAGSLGELARQTGTTVEMYQVLQRAAIENGLAGEKMDAAMKKLNVTLGQAKAGLKVSSEAFKRLGIDIKDVGSSGEVLPRVMDAIKNIKDPARQAAAAVSLFGRAGADLLPFLEKGSDGLNRMAREAQEAGLITAEMSDRADAASDKLDLLAYAAKTNLASAFLSLLPIIETITRALSRMMQIAARAFDWISRTGTQNAIRILDAAIATRNVIGMNPDSLIAKRDRLAKSLTDQPPVRSSSAITGDMDLDMSSGGGRKTRGGGKKGPTAEQIAEKARREMEQRLRDDHRHASDMRQANIAILRAQQDLADNYSDRATFAIDILNIEKEQGIAERRLAVQLGEMTEAQAAQLQEQADILDTLQRRKILLEEQEQRLQDVKRLEEVDYDIARERLEIEANAATTAAELRDVQLRILDLFYRQERARLEAVLADERSSAAAQEEARRRLELLDETYGARRDEVIRSTRNPFEAWAASIPKTAKEITEALQGIQVNALDGLADGLADVISGTKSLGEAFSDIARQIIADIIRMTIRMLIFNAVSKAFPGAFGGGIGAGASAAPRALGGPVVPGRRYLVGEQGPEEVYFPARGQVISNKDIGGGGEMVVHVNASPELDVRIERVSGRVVASAAPSIVRASTQHTAKSLGRPRIS